MRTLQAWFDSPLGRSLGEIERDALDRHLDRWTGARLLQVGGFGGGRRVRRANTSRQWLVDREAPADCLLEPERLPFLSDTMDIVVLVHALEFSSNPHRVLREAARVLAPEGHLVVLAFNRLSLWGLTRALSGRSRRGAPWNGRYLTAWRLRDWLALLDLETRVSEAYFYRPPLNRPKLQERLVRLERIGPAVLPWFGGVHLMVAQKHVPALTPLRPLRPLQPELVPSGLAQPRYWKR